MMQILDEKMVCNNAAQAEAAIKKHEAISAEILARVSNSFTVYLNNFLVLCPLAWYITVASSMHTPKYHY